MIDQPQPQTPLKLESVQKIPGFDMACRFYEFGKTTSSSLPLISGLIESAEKKALEVSTPYITRNRDMIERMDKMAIEQMAHVETLVQDTTTKIKTNTVVKKSLSIALAAESAVVSPMRSGLAIVEQVVDVVLPTDEKQQTQHQGNDQENDQEHEHEQEKSEKSPSVSVPNDEGNETETDDESANNQEFVLPGRDFVTAVFQCQSLASKTKQRSYRAAMSKVSDAQMRTTESIETLKLHSIDLIKYAMDIKEEKTQTVKDLTAASFESAKEVSKSVHKMAATKITVATEKVAATAEVVRAYRELLHKSFSNGTENAVAYVGDKAVPVKEFIKEQLDNSHTWEQFVAKLDDLKVSASGATDTVLSKTKDGGKVFYELMFSNATAMNMYLNFEEFADPFLFNLFKNARDYFTETETETETETNEEKEEESEENSDETDGSDTELEEDGPIDIIPNSDDENDVDGNDVDEGLVLKIRPRRSDVAANDEWHTVSKSGKTTIGSKQQDTEEAPGPGHKVDHGHHHEKRAGTHHHNAKNQPEHSQSN